MLERPRFPAGTKVYYKDGKLAFEKWDDNEFGQWALAGAYNVVEEWEEVEVVVHADARTNVEMLDMAKLRALGAVKVEKVKVWNRYPQENLPKWKKDKDGNDTREMNRSGWRWTDWQMWKEYGSWTKFVLPDGKQFVWKQEKS